MRERMKKIKDAHALTRDVVRRTCVRTVCYVSVHVVCACARARVIGDCSHTAAPLLMHLVSFSRADAQNILRIVHYVLSTYYSPTTYRALDNI